jgi:hypothetical protein
LAREARPLADLSDSHPVVRSDLQPALTGEADGEHAPITHSAAPINEAVTATPELLFISTRRRTSEAHQPARMLVPRPWSAVACWPDFQASGTRRAGQIGLNMSKRTAPTKSNTPSPLSTTLVCACGTKMLAEFSRNPNANEIMNVRSWAVLGPARLRAMINTANPAAAPAIHLLLVLAVDPSFLFGLVPSMVLLLPSSCQTRSADAPTAPMVWTVSAVIAIAYAPPIR